MKSIVFVDTRLKIFLFLLVVVVLVFLMKNTSSVIPDNLRNAGHDES